MVAAVDANTAASSIAKGRATLGNNFETFLSLLTTQLKNQDPLSPVDSTQFTSQLTQMAGVEQQLLTNDLLTSLVSGAGSGNLGSAVNYIGKTVTASGAATKLQGGAATWSYELAGNAAGATVSILNGQGNTVWTGPASDLTEGVHDFTWDGKTTGGTQLPDGGTYTMQITAAGAGGREVASQVLIRGTVSAVELYDGVPYATVGGSIVPLSQIISVEQRATAAAA